MSKVKGIGKQESVADVLASSVPAEFEGRVAFRKVNVEEAFDLANQFNIRGVPTLIFFKDGKAVDTVVGFASAGALRRKLEQVAGVAA